MSRLKNLSLMARGLLFVALMATLALSAVRGQASQQPADTPAVVPASVEGVPAIVEQPSLAETVVTVPFRITAEGTLERWAAGDWSAVTGLPSRATSLAVVDDANVYVGTESLGLFRSTDAGLTWMEVNNAGLGQVPGSALGITALAVDARDAAHVFAATAYLFGSTRTRRVPAGVYESRDGGQTWRALTAGRLPAIVTSIGLDELADGLVVAGWDARGEMRLGLGAK